MKYIIPFLALMVLASCNNETSSEKEQPVVWDTATAFFIDSAVEQDDVFLPDMRTLDTKSFTSYSLLPREYLLHHISDEMVNATWYTLTHSPGNYKIEQKQVAIEKIFDEEAYDTIYTVSGNRENEIHLANIANIKTGPINYVSLDTNVIAVGENVYFDYNGTHYRIYASGYKVYDMGVTNYRLNLEAQKEGVLTKQTLFAHSFYGVYRSCVLELLGDIDDDGELDIILKDAEFDDATTILYLSSGAEDGQLLKLSGVNLAIDPFQQGC